MDEFLRIIEIFNQFTPTFVLVCIIIYLLIRRSKFDLLQNDITIIRTSMENLHNNITWKDTCVTLHTEVNRRLDRLEGMSNGKNR